MHYVVASWLTADFVTNDYYSHMDQIFVINMPILFIRTFFQTVRDRVKKYFKETNQVKENVAAIS